MYNLKHFIVQYWGIICINLFLIVYGIIEGVIGIGNEDFHVYVEASKNLETLSNLYHQNYDMGQGGTARYIYPPFFAVILYPIQKVIAYKLLLPIWLFVNILSINRILYLMVNILNSTNRNLLILISFLLSVRFIMHNFDLGQMTLIWVYLMVEAYYQTEYKQKNILGSFLIGFGASIKFMPMFMLYYWFILKKWKPIFYTIIFIFLITISPFLFYPFEYMKLQFIECWQVVNPFQSGYNFQLIDQSPQSISSIIPYYLSVFKINLSEIQIGIIINSTRLILLIGILMIFKYSRSLKQNKYILFGTCCLSVSLFMPHQQHYSFFSAIILYSIWADWLIQKRELSKYALTCFILSGVLMICTSTIFIGSDWSLYCKIHKLIGLGAILLLVATYLQLKFENKQALNIQQY